MYYPGPKSPTLLEYWHRRPVPDLQWADPKQPFRAAVHVLPLSLPTCHTCSQSLFLLLLHLSFLCFVSALSLTVESLLTAQFSSWESGILLEFLIFDRKYLDVPTLNCDTLDVWIWMFFKQRRNKLLSQVCLRFGCWYFYVQNMFLCTQENFIYKILTFNHEARLLLTKCF